MISIQLTHCNSAKRICYWQELQVLNAVHKLDQLESCRNPVSDIKLPKWIAWIHLSENYWKVFVLFDTFEDWNILENVSGLQSCAFCGRLGGSWSNKRTSLKADPDSSNYWLCYKSAEAKYKKIIECVNNENIHISKTIKSQVLLMNFFHFIHFENCYISIYKLNCCYCLISVSFFLNKFTRSSFISIL